MGSTSRYTFTFEKLVEVSSTDFVGHSVAGTLFVLALITHFYNYRKGLGFTYWWFLVNGYLIHLYMDGLAAYFEYSKTTHYLYSQMDARFLRDDKMVAIVSLGETFVMGPLCIVIALLYKSTKLEHNLLREVLILVVSAFQICGTVVFCAQPVWAGFIEQCGAEGCFTFSIFNIFFFWFSFVFCDSIWIWQPIKEIVKSYRRLELLIKPQPQKVKKN
ncbi:unnamed protein product [Paramecium octaurelia]|uniref:EXPERA domain-containing protein n=1 Tax=Paramecium octaurelia TaxID=43137 RepID=A0A8S1UXF8_PAROT|nr:unnamed protein product [Paramecium octaurelia]